jgi:hypothetical protein
MVKPALRPRVEKRDDGLSIGIYGFHLDALETIAGRAAQPQIFAAGSAACTLRNDVLYLKTHRKKRRRCQAITATVPCILFYLLLQKYYVSGFVSGAIK